MKAFCSNKKGHFLPACSWLSRATKKFTEVVEASCHTVQQSQKGTHSF